MYELRSQIQERVRAARTSLVEARAAGDDYLATVREGELDALARVAAEHDLTIPELDRGSAASRA